MSSFQENTSQDENYFGQVRLKDDGVDFNDSTNIVAMKNIHKTYLLGIEGVPALRGVTMTIKRGEFVCIFGTSGGGKTTMLNLIGTIDKPTKGDMRLCGKVINHKTTDKDLAYIRLKNIGFVFQTFNLLSSLTALENVEMPMILLGELSAQERRERAISLLTKVGMKDRLDHVPSQLSGGEQQRVTIARAMANNPDILLLDEPTGDLDTVNTSIVMKLLTDLNRDENITLVMVTHDVGLKAYADRVIWMRDGKIQRIETVSLDLKKDSFSRLHKEIELINRNQKGGVTSVITSEVGVKKVTEMRKPTDYKSIASYSHPAAANVVPLTTTSAINTNLAAATAATTMSQTSSSLGRSNNQQQVLFNLEDDDYGDQQASSSSSSTYNNSNYQHGLSPHMDNNVVNNNNAFRYSSGSINVNGNGNVNGNNNNNNNDVYLNIESPPFINGNNNNNSIDSLANDIERIL
ncbi:hypothetical protein SAMD00019534_045610 [Acytostelium subglobosum LB1]|uniref:hypothetical protein n=1 Tax=Acytostelium subglobosum LB1 TaxID=1410327 RepID=UPI0006449C52|nr:hypothetical protein SAMD00019534_045610 [Acytostelium subglobosum LB1]GAM21386.1 hypothetical protein SAMD00019534_045610 [Acytostelium subglobosum LB1]|eukprot:XP_012755505.1 hypothetical protein SAMD00019534_045610 [Acytostelium subglobosum LB1]